SQHNVVIPPGSKWVKHEGSPAIEMAAVHPFTETPQSQPQTPAHLSAARSFSTPSQPKAPTALHSFTSAPQLQVRPAPRFQAADSYVDGSPLQQILPPFASMGTYTGAAQAQPKMPPHRQPPGALASSVHPRPQSQSFATANEPIHVYPTPETLKSPFAALEAVLRTKGLLQDPPPQAPEAGI